MMIALLQAKVDFVLKYFWEFTLKILPKKNNLSSVITYLFVFVIFSSFRAFSESKFYCERMLKYRNTRKLYSYWWLTSGLLYSRIKVDIVFNHLESELLEWFTIIATHHQWEGYLFVFVLFSLFGLFRDPDFITKIPRFLHSSFSFSSFRHQTSDIRFR